MLIIGKMIESKMFGLVPPSRRDNSHCVKIDARYGAADFEQFYPVGNVNPRKYDNPKRYCWMNLIETRRVGTRSISGYGDSPATGTIEIRLLGETADPDYVERWTRLWLTIAGYVAFVPSSLAIMHCSLGNSLLPLVDEVSKSLALFENPTVLAPASSYPRAEAPAPTPAPTPTPTPAVSAIPTIPRTRRPRRTAMAGGFGHGPVSAAPGIAPPIPQHRVVPDINTARPTAGLDQVNPPSPFRRSSAATEWISTTSTASSSLVYPVTGTVTGRTSNTSNVASGFLTETPNSTIQESA
jgi:hypothetical protein